jgi:hypothetical protein
MSFTNFVKIALRKNTKLPVNKWSDKNNQSTETPDTNKYNVGVLTGPINNLLVVDVDVKDDGLDEWKKYAREYGKPDTISIATPSGGFHYYFNFSHSDESIAYLIERYLNNRTKLRNKGIDIRSGGGYVVAPPSSINETPYKYIRGFDTHSITDIPESLVHWLLVGLNMDEKMHYDKVKTECKGIQPKHHNNHEAKPEPTTTTTYTYCITDDEIKDLLSKLPDQYLNHFESWLKVTTVLKRHDKYELWHEWSKTSDRYNYSNNNSIWKSNKGIFDINYLVYILNKQGHNLKPIVKYKPYQPLTKEIQCKRVTMNERFVFHENCSGKQFKYKYFKDYDTCIIKSITGTGKTTAVAAHTKQYMKENPETKLLSITARQSLSAQHVLSFKGIGMKSYLEKDISVLGEDVLTICINSLHRLMDLKDEELQNYIVYIDEISSFLELPHNDTLDNNLKDVYYMLMRFIKHANKVIVSDALINDAVLEFLKHRDVDTTIYIENNFRKYEGVEAVRVRDENELLMKLLEHCKENKYFLFGCDSCETVTKYYNKCLNEASKKDIDKYVLITADSNYDLQNANVQFKDRFVFYSPKITYGVDFSVPDAQDVFIYIKGNSIQPSGSFQQATRCRNINRLYFYGEHKGNDSEYESVEEVKQVYKQSIKTNRQITKVSCCLDENDEMRVLENTFFKLFCYNEYVKDTYQTNKEKHFELILESNGFIISEEGVPIALDKRVDKAMKTLVEEHVEDQFKEYLEADNRQLVKFDMLNKHVDLLGLQQEDKETLEEHQEILTNKYKIEEHLNIMRMLKSDEYIDDKLKHIHNQGFEVKAITSTYNKIKLLRAIEKTYDIQPLDVEFDKTGCIEMSDKMYCLFKTLFRSQKAKPTTYEELKQMYVGIIKSITCNEIINTSRNKSRTKSNTKRDTTEYKLNNELIQYHIKLNKHNNKHGRNFHDAFVEMFKMKVDVVKNKDVVNNGLDDGLDFGL